jgi:hypothetical protein
MVSAEDFGTLVSTDTIVQQTAYLNDASIALTVRGRRPRAGATAGPTSG